MVFNGSPTELTTGATDALLAIECVAIIVWLRRPRALDPWRRNLWCWVLGLVALSSAAGAVAHGLVLPEALKAGLWRLIYLSLGVVVGLFLVGACHDLRGRALARRLVPWSIGVGLAFFVLSEVLGGAFLVFVVYEAAAMLGALAIYVFLTAFGRLRGAGALAAAVLLNLVAAAVQASRVSLHLLVPLDHNGVFHLVQMAGIAVLGIGVALGMRTAAEGPEVAAAAGTAETVR